MTYLSTKKDMIDNFPKIIARYSEVSHDYIISKLENLSYIEAKRVIREYAGTMFKLFHLYDVVPAGMSVSEASVQIGEAREYIRRLVR